MFWKVIKNEKTIDALDRLVFLKYQKKHDRMVFCDIDEAQAILSSDWKTIWHEESLYKIPVRGYDTVRIEEIDELEYKQFKVLQGSSIDDIMDNLVIDLIDRGII